MKWAVGVGNWFRWRFGRYLHRPGFTGWGVGPFYVVRYKYEEVE